MVWFDLIFNNGNIYVTSWNCKYAFLLKKPVLSCMYIIDISLFYLEIRSLTNIFHLHNMMNLNASSDSVSGCRSMSALQLTCLIILLNNILRKKIAKAKWSVFITIWMYLPVHSGFQYPIWCSEGISAVLIQHTSLCCGSNCVWLGPQAPPLATASLSAV